MDNYILWRATSRSHNAMEKVYQIAKLEEIINKNKY